MARHTGKAEAIQVCHCLNVYSVLLVTDSLAGFEAMLLLGLRLHRSDSEY